MKKDIKSISFIQNIHNGLVTYNIDIIGKDGSNLIFRHTCESKNKYDAITHIRIMKNFAKLLNSDFNANVIDNLISSFIDIDYEFGDSDEDSNGTFNFQDPYVQFIGKLDNINKLKEKWVDIMYFVKVLIHADIISKVSSFLGIDENASCQESKNDDSKSDLNEEMIKHTCTHKNQDGTYSVHFVLGSDTPTCNICGEKVDELKIDVTKTARALREICKEREDFSLKPLPGFDLSLKPEQPNSERNKALAPHVMKITPVKIRCNHIDSNGSLCYIFDPEKNTHTCAICGKEIDIGDEMDKIVLRILKLNHLQK